jgi:hypothetical protein
MLKVGCAKMIKCDSGAARQKDCISGNSVDWQYIYSIRVSATWNVLAGSRERNRNVEVSAD